MNTLVIGYGSIGERHAQVLNSMGHRVILVSTHLPEIPGSSYRSLARALEFVQYEYIVVASPTNRHSADLAEICRLVTYDFVCLVEKPVFSSLDQTVEVPPNATIVVGYVLRTHPLLRRIRMILAHKHIYSCRSSVGQYLPTWRPNTDYRKCYSAQSILGGGVLRDLSHELDYTQLLCGPWKRVTAIGGKYSDLGINSDDQYDLLFESENCPICVCHMDYLSRTNHRDLWIEYEDGTLHLNFITGLLRINDCIENLVLDRNDLFRIMHSEALVRDLEGLTSYNEALKTLGLIEAAEKASKEATWIQR